MTNVFSFGKRTYKITKKHIPLCWECILGTVYAKNVNGAVKYFDYNYDNAINFMSLNNYYDLRLCKCPYNISLINYPKYKQLVLWGIKK
jgi:hypothetical protein